MNTMAATVAAALSVIITLSVHAEKSVDSNLKLSQLLRKGSTPNVTLDEKEKELVEHLLATILPDEKYVGDDKEWKIVYHDKDKGAFFHVDLKKKGERSFDRFIWFHILYKQDKPKSYGNEDFGKYRGMGMKDVHYFILVGNVEIRAIAASDEYKKDKMIKGILKAFKLKDIEKL